MDMYIKDFNGFLNENENDSLYQKGVDIALNSTIFGREVKSLHFPLVLATTGSGDEDGFYEEAWKISSIEELRRWLIEGHMKSKMFPGPDFEYDDEKDVAHQLAEDSWTDDFSNGIMVTIYSNEKEMREAEQQSEDAWGNIEDYDEDDRDHRLQDGDLIPHHNMNNTW